MKKRHHVVKSAKTRRKFNKTAHRTKSANLVSPMRGGFRF